MTGYRDMGMRILLTNDDGYLAPGLHALYDGLSEIADVTIVAPDRERSAVSLGITLRDPLRTWPLGNTGMKGWFINGTPADCIKIGYNELMPEKPDIIFSGINQGTNVGLNSNYSGTVGGAVEGAMLGVPSVAVSVTSFKHRDFTGAVRAARWVIDKMGSTQLPQYELLNVNVPPLPLEQIKGVRVARVAHVLYREVFDRRIDTRNHEYFWMGGEWRVLGNSDDGDDGFVREGYIAVTPLKVDWTAEETFERLRECGWDEDWIGKAK